MSNRRRVCTTSRSSRVLHAVLAGTICLLLPLFGCGGGTTSIPATLVPPSNTALSVTITGLPSGVLASVLVTSTNGYSATLTASQTVQVSPGTYTVTANVTSGSGLNYYSSPSTQTANVMSNTTTAVQVPYNTVIPTTTKVLDTAGSQSLTVSPDGLTLTISTASVVAASLSPGDVLASAPTPNAPNGLLARIVSVSKSGSTITAVTTQAALTDAIQSGSFQASQSAGAKDIRVVGSTIPGLHLGHAHPKSASLPRASTTPCPGNAIVLSADGTLSLSSPTPPGSVGSTVDLEIMGQAQLCTSIQVEVDFSWSQLQLISAKAVATLGGETSLKVEGRFDGMIKGKQKIGQATLNPIVVFVEFVPVVIVPQLTFYIGASGELSAGISTDLSDSVSLQAGFQYANGQPSLIATATHSYQHDPPALDVALSAKGFLETDVDFLFYGVIGPTLKPDAFLQLEADPLGNPWWSLTAGIEGAVGMKVSALGFHNLADFSLNIGADLTLTVAQAGGALTPSQIQPQLTSFSPATASAGNSGITMSISGSNFIPGAYALWNGSQLTTVFVDTQDLTVNVPGTDLANAGSYPVAISNPDVAGALSQSLVFTVVGVALNPAPSISSLSPSSLTVGSPSQMITINGTGFLTNSTVTFNRTSHTATFVSSTQLTIQLTSSDLATAGSFPVVVTHPPPGGGSSGPANLVVTSAGSASGSTGIIVGTVNGKTVDKAYVPVLNMNRVAVVNADAGSSDTPLLATVVMPTGYIPSATTASQSTGQVVVVSYTSADVQMIDAVHDTLVATYHSPVTQSVTFSGGSCMICGALIDPTSNQAILDTARRESCS